MSFISAHAINHRNYNWKIGDGTGVAPPVGGFVIFTSHAAPIPPQTLQPPPTVTRAAYSAFLKPAGSGVETFEEFDPGETMNGVTVTVNGVGMTFTSANDLSIKGPPYLNGRWNTTVGGARYVEFADGDGLGMLFSFDTPISAWGAYFTDIGDFSGVATITLNIHGGGTLGPYAISSDIAAPSGDLAFWGFVDVRPGAGHTYDSVLLKVSVAADGIGFDDINCATLAQLNV